jgi:hypothetical protein
MSAPVRFTDTQKGTRELLKRKRRHNDDVSVTGDQKSFDEPNTTRDTTQQSNATSSAAQLEELLLSFSRADEDAIARFSVDCTL